MPKHTSNVQIYNNNRVLWKYVYRGGQHFFTRVGQPSSKLRAERHLHVCDDNRFWRMMDTIGQFIHKCTPGGLFSKTRGTTPRRRRRMCAVHCNVDVLFYTSADRKVETFLPWVRVVPGGIIVYCLFSGDFFFLYVLLVKIIFYHRLSITKIHSLLSGTFEFFSSIFWSTFKKITIYHVKKGKGTGVKNVNVSQAM